MTWAQAARGAAAPTVALKWCTFASPSHPPSFRVTLWLPFLAGTFEEAGAEHGFVGAKQFFQGQRIVWSCFYSALLSVVALLYLK